MNRLTKDDVKEMGMVDLAHNQVFIKDGEAWYRDFERVISARDLAKEMYDFHNVKYSSNLDEFDEDMMYLLDDGYETIEGIIALFYRALWSMADVREILKEYEDTGLEPEEIKEAYDIYLEVYSKISEYANLMRQGRLIKLPCKVGDTVYHIFTGKIIEDRVIRITLNKDINEIDLRLYGYIALNSIGKTVFLTREEAEKALEVPNAKA